MAFLFQYRRLRQQVERQIKDLNDEEKSPVVNRQRLSGSTERGMDEAEEKDRNEGEAADPSVPEAIAAADHPYGALPGITPQTDEKGQTYFLVGWESPNDPENPHNWTGWIRLRSTLLVTALAFCVTAASSIDSAVLRPAAMEFHVSEVAESLATAIFLIGFGAGTLLAGPLSEMLGRYPVYLGTLVIFGIWIMAAGLAPNFGAQVAFRFLAGFFGSAPLTIAGGTISDVWNPKQRTIFFPVFAIAGFGGPILGPVIGAYIGYSSDISWRWSEWIILIIDGLVIFLIVTWKQETLAPQLLFYKARHYRNITGDSRFKSQSEAAGVTFSNSIKRNFSRPFILALEPIVFLFTLYLTVIYIVLFTFLDGYTYIFGMVYGINEGLTNIIFVAMFVGVLSASGLVPIVYAITQRQLDRDGDDGTGSKLRQETRLLFAMMGAPLLPIGLFWMGWTDYQSISIWSPIVASGAIGFGLISIFITAYTYVIDSYETYAASALTFVALVRYLCAGGMTVVGIPFYKNVGTHWTLTILGCISLLVTPVPYALYRWGPQIRAKSKYAVAPGT